MSLSLLHHNWLIPTTAQNTAFIPIIFFLLTLEMNNSTPEQVSECSVQHWYSSDAGKIQLFYNKIKTECLYLADKVQEIQEANREQITLTETTCLL